MNINFGDVVQVNLGKYDGCIQGGIRPAIIVQNNMGNKYSPTTIIIPLTSELKKAELPVHGIIKKSETNGLKKDSMMLGEQIRIVDKKRILHKIGSLDSGERKQVINVYLANIGGNHGEI